MGNILVKRRTAEKHNFEEFLKGVKKSFQEKKMSRSLRKHEHFPVKC